MPVHLFGRPASLDYELPVVEDAAQAFGAPGVGRTGIVSTYSFFPTKNLFALGDGGARHDRRRRGSPSGSGCSASTARRRRRSSSSSATTRGSTRSRPPCSGSSCRTSRSGTGCGARRQRATRSSGWARSASCPPTSPGHVYHVFVVRSPERDRIREHLASSGIASAAYYETPLHLQPALRFLGYSEGDFPETERASRENLALPFWAGIGADVQEQVVAAVREAVSLEAVR